MPKISIRRRNDATSDTSHAKGRAPEKAGRPPASKRYTPPVPREVRRSPRWFPWMLLGLLIVGILLIILNYASLLPASPSNWYTLVGLLSILAGALCATYYR